MSLARCNDCTNGKPPKGNKHIYNNYILPIGYPETSAICGAKNCENPAYIWLNQDEELVFSKGQRVFSINTGTMKVKVGDTLCKPKALLEG